MKIGVLGASSPVSPQAFEQAIKSAQFLGHEVVCPIDPSQYYGKYDHLFSCAGIEERISGLKSLLYDSSVELILAARGGYGAIELLPAIKQLRDEIKSKPLPRKVYFSGFSDATVLLLALQGIQNLEIIHGPGFISAFADRSSADMKESLDALLSIASSQWQGYDTFKMQQISGNSLLASVSCKFTGGNLSVLSSLIGAKLAPELTAKALFIEETGEKPHKIHRSLMQLKNSGALDNLSAVLLGEFTDCLHATGQGPDYLQVIKSIFADYSYPVFSGFPGGHGKHNFPLPFYRELELTAGAIKPT